MSFIVGVKRAYQDEWQFLQGSFWDRAQVSWIPWLLLGILCAIFIQAVPRALPIIVVDLSQGPISRELVRNLHSAPALKVVAELPELNEAQALVRSNQAQAVVYLPRQTDALIASNQSATLTAFYNASLSTAGMSAYRDIESTVAFMQSKLSVQYQGLSLGMQALKAAPIQAQTTLLYNPTRNFEVFLLGLLLPGLLHLMLCITVTSAYARELRDSSITAWFARVSDGSLPSRLGAVVGKASPYVLLFSLYGAAGLAYVAYVRGDGMAGSVLLWLLGNVLLYSAYAAVALLLVGLTRNMATALSGVGLFAGTSLAFCGATFPIDGAPLFARVWHTLSPFSSFVKLDAATRYMAAPLSLTLLYLGALLLFTLIPLGLGFKLYNQAANTPSVWGQR
ncbi:MAG: hypothetical protein RL217_1623 [Pseudomonadota bacterium]|jgi:ABC-2 type transport system permease protein